MKKNGENTDSIQAEVRELGDRIKLLEDKSSFVEIIIVLYQ